MVESSMSKTAPTSSVRTCKNCPKRVESRHKNQIFCSLSCATSYANKNGLRRKAKAFPCAGCGRDMGRSRSQRCSDCRAAQNDERIGLQTLSELRAEYSISQYHAKIRGYSRAAYARSGKPMECQVCAYDIHVDICHIRELQSFPFTSTVAEVNAIENLVALCRNHHWEMDNGHLSLTDTPL